MRYTIVPSHYSADDLGDPAFNRSKFHAVSAKEHAELVLNHAISCIDGPKRIWRWTDRWSTASSFRVRSNRISREVSYAIREVIVSEVCQQPIREEQYAAV